MLPGNSAGYLSNADENNAYPYTFTVGTISVRQPSKWTGTVCAVVCVHAVVSVLVGRGVGLTAFGDLSQCVLLSCATLGILLNTRTARQERATLLGSHGAGLRNVALCAGSVDLF